MTQSSASECLRTYATMRALSERSRIVDSPESQRRTVRSFTRNIRVAYARAESPDAATAAVTNSASVIGNRDVDDATVLARDGIGLEGPRARLARRFAGLVILVRAVLLARLAATNSARPSEALSRASAVRAGRRHRLSPLAAGFIALPSDLNMGNCPNEVSRGIPELSAAAVPQPEHPTP